MQIFGRATSEARSPKLWQDCVLCNCFIHARAFLPRMHPMFSAILLLVPAAAAFSCSSALSRSAVSTRHGIGHMSSIDEYVSPEEERERLSQLFGKENAEKIMSRSASARAKPKAEAAEEILMLQEGMQTLKWGAVRLVDVDMAPGPLEASFEPLLPSSSLLCARLELPLGMLLEEPEAADGGFQVVAELLDGGSARDGGGRRSRGMVRHRYPGNCPRRILPTRWRRRKVPPLLSGRRSLPGHLHRPAKLTSAFPNSAAALSPLLTMLRMRS